LFSDFHEVIKAIKCKAQWHIPIPARLRQENLEFEASMRYTMRDLVTKKKEPKVPQN
jgi:hypothetical protein